MKVPDVVDMAREGMRYVVLRHEGYGPLHWDLFIEVPGREKLLAWRMGLGPEKWKEGVKAQRGADHRKLYMTHEGEVSGGRGTVKRVAEGKAVFVKEIGQNVVLRLTGAEMDCEIMLPM